ncbi:MAG: radical SAM protein [Acidobacteria bacterium]|nr:radical SAM protein [Acidobacteriota bacterium]
MSARRSVRAAIRSLTGRSRRSTISSTTEPDGPPTKPFHAACYAAHTSMYFDQFGDVRACCQNTEAPMGNVTRSTIREIWDGTSARRLRDALRVDDYSVGCGFCQWQVDQGDDAIVFARVFDQHEVRSERPEWPVQMEFSMTNACNLQCVMCNGDWSSSIRTHREGRPPLPEVYGETFFEQLAEFLPHLHKANFLGGEPFLGKEPLRVLSMIAELDDPPEVAVTTNGTQWTPRIERICERVPMSFVLSLDGITAATYESIRVGSDFELVMRNLEHFEEHAGRNGTMVTLAHCLVRQNAHEFASFLAFAERRGFWVGINEVLFPAELSLFQLPADGLRSVIAQLEADPVAGSLDRLRYVWDGQLDALRHRLVTLERGQAVQISPWGDASVRSTPWADRAAAVLAEWVEGEPPTEVRFTVAAPTPRIEGLHAALLEEFGALDSTAPEALVDRLAAGLDDAPVRRTPDSDLLHDVILGPATAASTEVRLAWDDAVDGRTVLVAVRNPPGPPPLPDDPWAELVRTSAPGGVVIFTCDTSEEVTAVDGDTRRVLGLEGADLLGRRTEQILERLTSVVEQADLGPGPSGREADSTLDLRSADGTTRRLRVMVDRSDVVTVAVGLLPSPD